MDSKQHNDYTVKNNIFFSKNHLNFSFFERENEIGSQHSLANSVKHYLLLVVEKLFMSRNPRLFSMSDFDDVVNEANDIAKNSNFFKGKYASKQTNKVSRECKNYDFPLINFIAFLTMLMFKLATSQIGLCIRFFTYPIWCLNSFTCNSFKPQKSALRLAVRFCKASLCAAYTFIVLFWLLVSGFVIGGVIMRNLVQESIHIFEPFNFDYTKSSPTAVVPIASNFMSHKLHVTVSLTLPESEHNRNLGIFQVRVERLSANGEVMQKTSYPTMLRFKSRPVRAVETLFSFVPLITRLKSQVQTLKIVMGDFVGRHETTSFFKVILEQRAEVGGGSGVPETYGASMEIASELPRLKKMIYFWRRTIFVWISFGVFLAQVLVFVIFWRRVILPGGRSKGVGNCNQSWYGTKLFFLLH